MNNETVKLTQTILKYVAGGSIVGMWMYLVVTKLAPVESIISVFLLILSALGIHTFTTGNNNGNVNNPVQTPAPTEQPKS